MKHILMMVIGCGLALLLIFLLPDMRLGSGWVLAVAFGAMMLCHLMHFGMHKDEEKGEVDHEHRHGKTQIGSGICCGRAKEPSGKTACGNGTPARAM